VRIGADLPSRPVGAGAVRLALGLLAEADAAAARLAAAADPEALHDFRVGLRRLRTALRAFRPVLGGAVRRRHLRSLGALARATGAARDAEVQLAWLEAQRARLRPAERAGAEWVARRLAGELDAADRGRGASAHASVLAEHGALAAKLRARLARAAREEGLERGPTFGHALAALLRPARAAFVDRAAALVDAREVEPAHAARIAGKRLRYLLEPLRGTRGANASAAVARLRGLQDLLGELHDAHVLEAFLHDLPPRTAASRHAAGLAALGRLAAERRDALFSAFVAAREAGAFAALERDVEALTKGLERLGSRPRAAAGAARRSAPRRARASTMMRAPRSAPDGEGA